MVLVGGSIIASDLLNLEKVLRLSEESNLDWLHFDVMDGNFVPNITIGIETIKLSKRVTTVPIDVHLMVFNPEKYIDDIIEFCDMINFHIEAVMYPIRLIENIKLKKPAIKVGVAINPITSVDFLDNLKDMIDNVLIMTVEPGFAYQKFIPTSLGKIERVCQIIRKWEFKPLISVDGGINEDNYKIVIEKGVNYLVCGSYLYKESEKIKERVLKIKNVCKS